MGEINDQHQRGNFTFEISLVRINELIGEKAVNKHRQLALDCVNEMGGKDLPAFRKLVERRLVPLEQQKTIVWPNSVLRKIIDDVGTKQDLEKEYLQLNVENEFQQQICTRLSSLDTELKEYVDRTVPLMSFKLLSAPER